MSKKCSEIDLWDPEAEMVKFIGENAKICQYKSKEQKIDFSEDFQTIVILYEPSN